ncbi:MAG: hypothetical protein PHV93_01000 [Candidatus Pacebacteria bacterium]|nr:hypothetical protein [Candidatus Paceibacterota bacterium]
MLLSFFQNKRIYCGATRKRGTTLVEALIYIFILVLLLLVIVDALVSFSHSFNMLQSGRDVENSAIASFERITREIRDAKSIDVAQSSFGSSPGQLFLNTTDANGNTETIQFYLVGQALHVKENGTDEGALTRSSVRVTSLIFQHISTSLSEAVKISMTIESGSATSYKSASFYDSATLRGSYPLQ